MTLRNEILDLAPGLRFRATLLGDLLQSVEQWSRHRYGPGWRLVWPLKGTDYTPTPLTRHICTLIRRRAA